MNHTAHVCLLMRQTGRNSHDVLATDVYGGRPTAAAMTRTKESSGCIFPTNPRNRGNVWIPESDYADTEV